MGLFGIGSKEEQAIKQLLSLEDVITNLVVAYHQKHTEIPEKKLLKVDELVKFVQGDLLMTYLKQVDRKDKESKYFFKGGYFTDYVEQSISKIYNLCDQFDAGYKKNASDSMKQISKGAEETLGKINACIDKINNARSGGNSRTNEKK